ncbi:NADH dehydrogenase [Amphibacillus marinus]|uniref:NADH dehydrogenase n=2 Tax=Amphibacillus marinus TaxID=872970 RepID=A0A1H8S009_9BACI|nr:NADH dehydrogenase [Amphibacillus marinus]
MMTNIVIIGAGYAGFTCTLRLQKLLKKENVSVTLINQHDYHYQTTWLHRHAVGIYDHTKTTFPIADYIDADRVQFVQDRVVKLNADEKLIETINGKYGYDYLVVALGSEIDSFQIPGLEQYAHSITTIKAADRFYQDLVQVLRAYSNSNKIDPIQIVIGGGGFTGVELLGELTDRLPELCNRFAINPKNIKLVSIETQPTVLPEFDLELGEYAMQQLEKKGVEFRLSTKIKTVEHNYIKIERAGLVEDIPAHLFVWTAGVKGNRIIAESDIASISGRVEVDGYLRAPAYHDIYIIGDVAIIKDRETAYLPNADLAIQKANYCAKHIHAQISRELVGKPFFFKPWGNIASIGAKDGIGVVGRQAKIFGRFAALLKFINDGFVLYQIGRLKMLRAGINQKNV